MKLFRHIGIAMLCGTGSILTTALSYSQGIHFSQYYQAPSILNPANTALMPTEEFRLTANYRNQWANVPVNYNTFAATAEFQALRGKNLVNWVGIGGGFYSDKAGDGALSLNKLQLNIAYHLGMGDYSMLSAGLTVGSVSRSVNLQKLTFDAQWDGYKFNSSLPQQEFLNSATTSYLDMGIGMNYAYFPSDDLYMKIGLGVQHINRPKESFYKAENQLKMRPVFNAEALALFAEYWIFNPSIYYTYQSQASELVGGALLERQLSNNGNNQFIMGLFYRYKESFIPVIGLNLNQVRIMASYDVNVAGYNKGYRSDGAFELSIIYQGHYQGGGGSGARKNYACPRF